MIYSFLNYLKKKLREIRLSMTETLLLINLNIFFNSI